MNHNKYYIKVSENSVKNFSDTHPPFFYRYTVILVKIQYQIKSTTVVEIEKLSKASIIL